MKFDSNQKVCGEAGRQMFFSYAGIYFAAEPALKKLPLGTVCPMCGANDVQLWMTNSKEPSCLAQQTITRKRAARESASVPPTPAANPAGKTAIAEGSVVLAGPYKTIVLTKVLPNVILPDHVDIRFSSTGSVVPTLLEIVSMPIKRPFVLTVFGKNAKFPMMITNGSGHIVVNGPESFTLNLNYMTAIKNIVDKVGVKEIDKMIEIRTRLALGDTTDPKQREKDQEFLLSLQSSNSITMKEFRSLPPASSPESRLIRNQFS